MCRTKQSVRCGRASKLLGFKRVGAAGLSASDLGEVPTARVLLSFERVLLSIWYGREGFECGMSRN